MTIRLLRYTKLLTKVCITREATGIRAPAFMRLVHSQQKHEGHRAANEFRYVTCLFLHLHEFLLDACVFLEPGKWRTIMVRFLPVGICLVAVMQWRAFRKQEGLIEDVEVVCYKSLPLKMFSRCWGFVADLNLPTGIRPFVLKTYINLFKVNLAEAANEDLTTYTSISEFFVRRLKDGARVISEQGDLVAPCDGTVLHVSRSNCDRVEQVKGITYSVEQFLGGKYNTTAQEASYTLDSKLLRQRNQRENNLCQITIYLAPGDYHRFHSPAVWTPKYRRHISGELLSVNPFIANRVPSLFCLNERAVYIGEWIHGFFSYAAVGATCVGNIRVYFDKTLNTNKLGQKHMDTHTFLSKPTLTKGEMLGEFRMGSTIVMLFEAPPNFEFTVKSGQKVRLGQEIGRVADTLETLSNSSER